MSGCEFIYRKVIDGKGTLLPGLRPQVERAFPNHQRVISNILSQQKVPCAKVLIAPCEEEIAFGGLFTSRISGQDCWIILGASTRAEMVTTLLHECVHYHHPELHGQEKEVEMRALHIYGRSSSPYLEELTKIRR